MTVLPRHAPRLQARCILLLCAAHAAAAQDYEVAENGLPVLNSNPGALSVAYLDFDGGPTLNGVEVAPFGGDLVFDGGEQSDIYDAWFDVATHFAMFDINVTTVAPNKSINPTSHVIISPDVSGGSANVNFHGNTGVNARGQNAASHATSRTTAITHELGHILGLRHLSEFDENGDLLREYRRADEWNRAALMGVDYAGGLYAHWGDGLDLRGVYQDDADLISSKIVSVNNSFSGNAYAGDGFRIDEHGDDFSDATPLLMEQVGGSIGNFQVSTNAQGIVERYADVDVFSLLWTGGTLSMSAQAVRSHASGQAYASSVGLNLTVYDSAGSTIAQDLAANPADVSVAFSQGLDAGQYYFAIEGAGGIGDLGAYEVSLDGTTEFLMTPGDLNGDLSVDAEDWVLYRLGFGADLSSLDPDAAYARGDLNLDGANDRFDFNLFRDAYEQANGPGSFAALSRVAPEPASLAQFLLAGGCLLARRQGHRSRSLVGKHG